MTAEQIELYVERRTDAIDARFLSGQMTQAEYDHAMALLNDWAEGQYATKGGDQ